MIKINNCFYYSTSDLIKYMESPFASWMDRCSLEYPELILQKDPPDALINTLKQKGYDHENKIFNDFRSSSVKIKGTTRKEKLKNTIDAMIKGHEKIFQANFKLDPFYGIADFLIKIPGKSRLGNYHYEIMDTKLANKVKVSSVVQMCCYTEMIEVLQGVRPIFINIILGNGNKHKLRTNDFFHYYLALKRLFLETQFNFNIKHYSNPENSKKWGNWSEYAKKILVKKDHLSQVANITKKQIKKINQSKIFTMEQLSNSIFSEIPGIKKSVFFILKSQAKAQLKTKEYQDKDVDHKPYFKILLPKRDERSGLVLLPPHTTHDVFFDIEGYTLDDGGLEYLWGCTYFNKDGKRDFKDFWAHNREEEKKAFQQFIEWVYSRWKKNNAMHIYHYANYEIAACRKLMGRFGVCEYEVDQLLRNDVFVDLYKIVKSGLLLGESNYSIKNVEHLYRGKRKTKVGSGVDSIVVYDEWRKLHYKGEEGNTWQTSKILKYIRDYNIDDCNSTQELYVWLLEQQRLNSINFISKKILLESEKKEITERTQLRDLLLQQALVESKHKNKDIKETLAWILEFHRREAKPVFWRLFDRLTLSHDSEELINDFACLAYCKRTKKKSFKLTSKAKNFCFEYSFDSKQKFKERRTQFYLLGLETEENKRIKVKFIKKKSNIENGFIVIQAKKEPPKIISLIPDEYVNPNPIPQAINEFVLEYESGQFTTTSSAIIDFLQRNKPRIKGQKNGIITSSDNPSERLKQIIQTAINLDNSYLTIQGPPGTGKTYTGKHIIAELLKLGARIGITSNSHKAINNLLISTAKYCKEKDILGSFVCTKYTETELKKYNVSIIRNNELSSYLKDSCVLGSTTWGFARKDMIGQLDYLFVDEAGQVAMANLIAMSRASKNLILLGDQMQLGQPTQGIHPGESGSSILEYLLQKKPTISNDMGIFLGTTFRMHSKINRFISEYIYESKLKSDINNDSRIVKVPDKYTGRINKEAGIVFVPVVHEGNTQCSHEEISEIVNIARDLIGREFITSQKENNKYLPRLIGWTDILFIAPYNHQVIELKKALGEKAKVGTVDKFQGQEAPIVLLSMCISDATKSFKEFNFIFDKRRINVAISRAQVLAIIVGNPKIATTLVNNIDQLKILNLFNVIINY